MSQAPAPAAIARDVRLFVERGIVPPEHTFLRALLENHALNVIAYMPTGMTPDELRACARMVFNDVPGRARGSRGAVLGWPAELTAEAKP